MVTISPAESMTTPLPLRSRPRVDALRASVGTVTRSSTTARSASGEAAGQQPALSRDLEPGAGRRGAGARRAAAGAGRRRHRQDPGADHPAVPPDPDAPRLAVADPGRDLHEQGGARDARAHRRPDRPD